MTKDKDYYTKPIFPDSCYTQCLWDLAGGEIKIYDIPFEYRPGLAYILAKKAIRYEIFGKGTQKKLSPELCDKEADLLSVFDTCIEDEYLQLSEENDLFWHKYGTGKLFKKLYAFN